MTHFMNYFSGTSKIFKFEKRNQTLLMEESIPEDSGNYSWYIGHVQLFQSIRTWYFPGPRIKSF